MAQLTLSQGKAGGVRVRIVVATGRAEPMNPKEITLHLEKPDAGIEPISRQARKVETDEWEVASLALPVAGAWKAKVDILVDDFEEVSLEGTMTVGH